MDQYLVVTYHKTESTPNQQLTVGCRNCPVLVERPTPSKKQEQFHDDETDDDVGCDKLDKTSLF
jgi:hypothetical protein